MRELNDVRCTCGFQTSNYDLWVTHVCGTLSLPSSSAGGLGIASTSAIPKENKKAAKNDQEKADISLIPYISNIEHARAFQVGERKYGRYNYCKGHKASQLVAAIGRHSQAWFNGEERDPVDGQHHLGSVMACCSMLLRQMELGTMVDDRYKVEDTSDNRKK